MTKKTTYLQLLSAVAEKNNSTPAEARSFLEAFVKTLDESLVEKGDRVTVQNFGAFEVRHHKGHVSNLYGQEKVPGYQLLYFAAAQAERNRINGKEN